MNDFATDDVWQRQQRDALLKPFYYGKLEAAITYADDDMDLQRRGIDTVACFNSGKIVTFEEKIVRWPEGRSRPYEAFAFETESCTNPGFEKEGWMRYSEAMRLLYCFQMRNGGLDCYLLLLQELKAWFWSMEGKFSPFQMATKNRTRGRVVPIVSVPLKFEVGRFVIDPVT